MIREAARELNDPPPFVSRQMWVLAVFFFGVGDLFTTGLGLSFAGVAEAGPVTAPLVERYGVGVIGLLKLVMLGGCFLLWKAIPHPHSVGVPLGLTTVGISATSWNVYVLVLAVLQ